MEAFFKKGGVKTEEEFYKKYPTEDDFFKEHPDMFLMKYQQGIPGDCPEGYAWSISNQQCLPQEQQQVSDFSGNKNNFITGALNPQGVRVGGVGATQQPFHDSKNSGQQEDIHSQMKRKFGTPNIPNIIGTNLLSFGLSTVANNIEEGRQKAFMQKQMNDPLFNGTYSKGQNDYGVDPNEQAGLLRKLQQGGRAPIYGTREQKRAFDDSSDAHALSNSVLNASNYKNEKLSIVPFSKKRNEGVRGDNPLAGNWDGFLENKNIKPYQMAIDKTRGDIPVMPIFKKPVQPIHTSISKHVNDLIGYNTKVELDKLRNNPNMEEVFAPGGGKSLGFKKKLVKPEPQEPKFAKPSPIPRTQTGDVNVENTLIPSSNPSQTPEPFDYRKPTKYSFTTPTGKYNEQESVYFPDEKSWKEFIKDKRGMSSQQGSGYGTATGYMQSGGVYETQQELDLANAQARKRFSDRGLMTADEIKMGSKVGDLKPPIIYMNPDGTQSTTPFKGMQPKLATSLPNYIGINDLQSDGSNYWYLNNEGSTVDVDPGIALGILNKRKRNTQTAPIYGDIAKFQQGGQFDILNYIYGDDEEESSKKETPKEEKKKKRITEEDVNNSDNELAALGLSPEDIVGMDSPVRKGRRYSGYDDNSEGYSGSSDYTSLYLKHQQGAGGIKAILKAASQGLDEVPNSWNKENIQGNMENNVGKDFKGKVTPASFLNYWDKKVNNHMKIASKKQTPYDDIFLKVGQEEGINPLFLKAVANMESGINPNNNTSSKYKGMFALNSKDKNIKNIFDPYSNTKQAAKNLKGFKQGGEFSVDFNTLKELQSKGIKFKIID